jgi:hypothetical protein
MRIERNMARTRGGVGSRGIEICKSGADTIRSPKTICIRDQIQWAAVRKNRKSRSSVNAHFHPLHVTQVVKTPYCVGMLVRYKYRINLCDVQAAKPRQDTVAKRFAYINNYCSVWRWLRSRMWRRMKKSDARAYVVASVL